MAANDIMRCTSVFMFSFTTADVAHAVGTGYDSTQQSPQQAPRWPRMKKGRRSIELRRPKPALNFGLRQASLELINGINTKSCLVVFAIG